LSPILWDNTQVADAHEAVFPAVAGPQVSADAPLGRLGIWVVAVVQDRLLDIAEKGFRRVVVWAPLGQTRPPQTQLPHQPLRLLRFAGVSRVLIQSDPQRLRRIPPPDPTHEPADRPRPFAGKEPPADPAVIDLVKEEQVEPPPRLLLGLEDQLFLAGVAPPAVGLDRNRLDVEENQEFPAATVPPQPLEPAQDRSPLRVGAQEFATHATQAEPPFFSTLRRCSRLMAFTRRRRIK
jgi:hypothetical protein